MKISPTQSDFLNLSRWTAAWLVLAEHVRALVFADYSACSPGAIWRPFYFLTGFGHEAVMIFFVISGYLVGGKVVDSFRSGKFQWRKYLLDRISRLYAVLLVALIIGGLLDWIGLRYANAFGLYDASVEQPIALITKNISDDLNASALLANAGFLQTINAPTFGSNGPLWSLANEWWYYILFPLCLSVYRSRGVGTKLLSGGLVIALGWFLPFAMLALGGVWLFGVVIAQAQKPWLPWQLAMIMTVATLLVARLEVIAFPMAGNALIGLSFGLLLNSLMGSSRRYPLHGYSLRLADFSYSLYLLHFPLILVILSTAFTYANIGLKMQPSGVSLLIFSATCLAAIGWSWLVSRFTEARTPLLRDQLYAWSGVTARGAA
jgi:peptidoglycan/LPS O-acetylase OafA/YrhL